jgi:hypothetical protein
MRRELRIFICICVSIFGLFNVCDSSEYYGVDILQPFRSHTAVGGKTHVLALISRNSGRSSVNNANVLGHHLELLVNDQAVFATVMANSMFECVLVDPTLTPGWNTLTLQLKGKDGGVLAHSSRTVFMNPLGGEIVENSRFGARMVYSSVLAVGVGAQVLVSLARIDPYIMTVLDADASSCRVLGSPKYSRCIPLHRVSDISLSLYYDDTYISYEGLLEVFGTASLDENVSGSNPATSQIIRMALNMTQRTLWLWAPPASVPSLLSLLHNYGRCITHYDLRAGSIEPANSSGLPTVDSAFGFDVGRTTEELLARAGQHLLQVNCTCVHDPPPESRTAASRDAKEVVATVGPKFGVSSIAAADWRVGRVHVHLRNACLLRDGRSLLVFNNGSQQEDIWGDVWDKAASSEDYGFQYTPLLLRPVSVTGPSKYSIHCTVSSDSILTFHDVYQART